jgi:hypothetical protein
LNSCPGAGVLATAKATSVAAAANSRITFRANSMPDMKDFGGNDASVVLLNHSNLAGARAFL